MKKPFLIAFLLLVCYIANAQNTKSDSVYGFTDVMPAFKNGDFLPYLAKNIRYPVNAAMSGIRGKVLVQFIVKKDGSISNAIVIRPVSPDIDAEALRVVNSSPKWDPGMQAGIPVDVRLTIPITFNTSVVSSPFVKNTSQLNDTTVIAFDDIVSFRKDDPFSHIVQRVPVTYSKKALENGLQGVVTISFIAEKDSSASKIRVVKKVSPELDNEAVRVVSATKWIPYIISGKPRRILYKVQIPFKIEDQ